MKHWCVLYSKPRKEAYLRHELVRRDIEAYLPLWPAGRRSTRPKPLFFRYLFAHLDMESVSLEIVRWVPGLTSFLSFGGQYAVVDEVIIEHIRRRTAQMERHRDTPFRPGERVRITSDHPMAMLDAVFDRSPSGGARAHILVQALGRLTRLEVDADWLESAEASRPRAGLRSPDCAGS